ncbi:AMP-binding protein [Reyranella sp. CPCC 100927]|uniref:AMP-binding protein n=1 Tax=Reyranella sp. CPCC 100927 TaxID=2599616 RepID=UPI0015B58431|nr:AMP-binding protein [Reyranella sp. CPCC 100927]
MSGRLHWLAQGWRDLDVAVAWRGATVLRRRDFLADVARVAGALHDCGCRRGAVVATDAYWFAVGLFALLHAGSRVVVPPNVLPDTMHLLADQFDLLLVDEALPVVVPTFRIDRDSRGNNGRDLVAASINADIAVFEFYTSGSTGEPKRINKMLAEMDIETDVLDSLWNHAATIPPTYATVPHQHYFGLVFRLLWPLAAGRPFAVETDILWDGLLARASPQSVLVTSPAHLTRLKGIAPLSADRRFAQVFTAGAPLPRDAADQAEAILGVRPTEIFGSTETGTIATRVQREGNEPWQPLPGIAIDVNAGGCLNVSSPYVLGGRFQSSDLVEVLPDNAFRFHGRADHVVKIEGKRISLPEVELALRRLPLIAAAAVVTLDGATMALAAIVELTADGRRQLQAMGAFRLGRRLRRDLASTLEPSCQPRRWRFVDSIPSGPLGKRQDVALRALFDDPA